MLDRSGGAILSAPLLNCLSYEKHIVPELTGRERYPLVFMKRMLAVLVVVTALSAGAAAAHAVEVPSPSGLAKAAHDSEGIGIKLLDIPEATQNDPRARSYIVDQVDPGTLIERRVQVQNNSDSDTTVYVYVGAANVDGGNFVGEANPSKNELTAWTSLEHSELHMSAASSIDVLATIDVPFDASEGEQYAVIWVEQRSAPVDGSSIMQASRAGIRIYLSVGAGNGSPANFEVGSLTPSRDDSGAPTLSALVTNIGGRAVDISGDLTLANGPAGLSAGPFSVQQATTLAPGDSGEVVFTLSDELPNGPWDATLALKSGLVEREASATITFPDAGVGDTVAPNESPMLLIALVSSGAVLLLLAAGTFWWLRRRKAAAEAAAIEAANAAASVST